MEVRVLNKFKSEYVQYSNFTMFFECLGNNGQTIFVSDVKDRLSYRLISNNRDLTDLKGQV